MIAPTPHPPRFDRAAAVRRAARDILIGARIIELRRLARRTAAGELPAPPDDPPEDGDRP
jgi:hypothetical protein